MWTITDLLADILKVLLDLRAYFYGAGKNYPTDYFRSAIGQGYAKDQERAKGGAESEASGTAEAVAGEEVSPAMQDFLRRAYSNEAIRRAMRDLAGK